MRTRSGKGLRGKATRMHAALVRSRGHCARCGSTVHLQCAHIIPRRYSATRTDERNAWCLCAGCHLRLTEHPDEHMAFVRDTIGMRAFNEMKRRALAGVKANDAFWQDEVIRLESLLREAA